MNKKNGGGRLRPKELRELRRINASRRSVSACLGTASEKEAELIFKEAQSARLIENFWYIPSHSALDYRGVDFICKTVRGYFLLNTKKSLAGLRSFEQEKQRRQENNTQLFLIYPLRVTLDVGKRQDVRTELAVILNREPSFRSSLPEDIRQELVNPTYP